VTRTLILFGAGTALLLPFEYTLTIVAGVALLLAAIVSGLFALLTPERLEGVVGTAQDPEP
jgi:hypothetical protein